MKGRGSMRDEREAALSLVLEISQAIQDARFFIRMYSIMIHSYEEHLKFLKEDAPLLPKKKEQQNLEIQEYKKRIVDLYKKIDKELVSVKDFLNMLTNNLG